MPTRRGKSFDERHGGGIDFVDVTWAGFITDKDVTGERGQRQHVVMSTRRGKSLDEGHD